MSLKTINISGVIIEVENSESASKGDLVEVFIRIYKNESTPLEVNHLSISISSRQQDGTLWKQETNYTGMIRNEPINERISFIIPETIEQEYIDLTAKISAADHPSKEISVSQPLMKIEKPIRKRHNPINSSEQLYLAESPTERKQIVIDNTNQTQNTTERKFISFSISSDPGIPLIISFLIMLATSIMLFIQRNIETATILAKFAFVLLIIGVGLQILTKSQIKIRQKIRDF